MVHVILVDVMATQESYGRFKSFTNMKNYEMYSIDLEVFIEFLIEKGFIQVVQSDSKNELIFHRDYQVM